MLLTQIMPPITHAMAPTSTQNEGVQTLRYRRADSLHVPQPIHSQFLAPANTTESVPGIRHCTVTVRLLSLLSSATRKRGPVARSAAHIASACELRRRHVASAAPRISQHEEYVDTPAAPPSGAFSRSGRSDFCGCALFVFLPSWYFLSKQVSRRGNKY